VNVIKQDVTSDQNAVILYPDAELSAQERTPQNEKDNVMVEITKNLEQD
jgi:hypothetical protein